MTDTTFGPEIAVNGKRPDWLTDDRQIIEWSDDAMSMRTRAGWVQWETAGGIRAIRLPADHFAYKALDAGFEPWGGGYAAPADWDGGEVLWATGSIEAAGSWRHAKMFAEDSVYIIGYHKRTPAVTTPADTVQIARMTEAEWRGWIEGHTYIENASRTIHALAELGLVKPETTVERFTRETGHELPSDMTPEMRALVEAALAWERGK